MVDLGEHIVDHFKHALACHRRSLMVIHAMLLCKLRSLFGRDDYLISQVQLIANDDNWCVRILHFVDGLNPIANRFKRLFTRLVEGDDDAIGLTIELIRDVSKLLLTGSVPNFHVDLLLVLLVEIFKFNELYCYGLQMIGLEISFVESPEQARLANRCIA